MGTEPMPRPVNSGSAPGRCNNTDNDNSVIKTEGAWLHTSLGLMSIGLKPRAAWFGVRTHVSSPNCISYWALQETGFNQIRLSLSVWRDRSLLRVFLSLHFTVLSLIFSYKMTGDAGVFPFSSTSGACIFPPDVPSHWPWAFYSATSLPVLSALTV